MMRELRVLTIIASVIAFSVLARYVEEAAYETPAD